MKHDAVQSVNDYSLRCLVRTPRPPAAARGLPLLCFLHGYDEAAPMDIFAALTRHGPLRAGNPAGELDRFIVVAPQLPAAGDSWYGYAEPVRRIVSGEAAKYRCDLSRVYLTGFSFGGNGVFDLATASPDLWAALWAVDPTRVPAGRVEAPIWVSLGQISRYQADAFIRRLELEPPGIVPGDRRVWSDDGENHVGTATLAYRDEEIYRWLLNWSLNLPSSPAG